MSGCWLHLQTAGDFVSHLVMSGETAGLHGRQLVRPRAVLGDFLSQRVMPGETVDFLGVTVGILGETAGILGETFGILGETAGLHGRQLVRP